MVAAFARTYGAEALIMRASNNYGPYQYPEKLIPLCILNALAGTHCRSTATACRCATGCMWTIAAQPWTPFSKAASRGTSTTSAGPTSSRTSR